MNLILKRADPNHSYRFSEPAPKLPADRFKKHTCDFLDACLLKEHDARPTPKTLTDFEWFKVATQDEVDLVQWASTLNL